MRFANVHERWVQADAPAAAALIDGLAGADDRLWPSARWPRMRLDRPLGEGAAGGHGPIRYVVEAYEPGRLVSFRFEPQTGFGGRHWIEATPMHGGISLRHVVSGTGGLIGWLRWWAVIGPLHDALLQDALDNAERALTGRVRAPARWSLRVRLLRALLQIVRRAS